MPNDSDNFEQRLSTHARQLLKTHETLLRDSVRNRAFYDALKRNVTDGSAVLDIGSGTGVWAVAAAKLGARRVVAIDADELMVGVIKMLAAEHGVGDRVEAIWGSSFDVQLEREFDVVVSETIGYFGYDENIVAIMQDARRRFLKSGGVVIPETVSIYAAAGRLKVRQEPIPTGLPFELDTLRRLNLYSPVALRSARDIKLLTKPFRLIETDLRKAAEEPSLQDLTGGWGLENVGEVNCLAVWVESRLTKGVRLSTRRTTSWRPTVYRIEPVDARFTRLDFALSIEPGKSSLTVTRSNGSESVSSQYSSDLAATEMIIAARNPGSVVNRNGRIFLDKTNLPLSVRPADDGDSEFLLQLYCRSRQSEVEQFGWGEAEIESFLRMQFGIRDRSYQIQFADAEQRVILYDGDRAGSMIVARTNDGIVLADIAVSPEYRKRGIASNTIQQLKKESGAIVLHVDKVNQAALGLYTKLGFKVSSATDLQYEMKWTQPS